MSEREDADGSTAAFRAAVSEAGNVIAATLAPQLNELHRTYMDAVRPAVLQA